ncbi:MAG TPA: ATP-binding protein [Candidatus Binatia bacterium]|nr:ATP-binding protein [Candidatus Binatia bacterium]
MRDSDVDLYTFERLRDEFGPFIGSEAGDNLGRAERELVGSRYREMLRELNAIVSYQWKEHLERSALKGFLFHGGVGVGKTAMAKRLAYELCRSLGDNGAADRGVDEVVMVLVDGGDVARGRYGDTEEKIREIFKYARDGQSGGHHRHDDDPKRRTILLFDDVESLFLTRNSSGVKEWHFSQNSIFFHSIDDLDTAHTAVILTTNRIDLVDAAIADRFLSYEFAAPSVSVLEQIARYKAALQRLEESQIQPILDAIHTPGAVKSIREVERMVMRAYIGKLLKPAIK